MKKHPVLRWADAMRKTADAMDRLGESAKRYQAEVEWAGVQFRLAKQGRRYWPLPEAL